MTVGDGIAATDFQRWLSQMRTAGLARSDADCGRKLGVTARHIFNMKRHGASRQTALACAALINQLKPFGD